ncbi:MAG: RNA polymerase sigma factor [Planctomycetota bacterium]
MTDNRIDDTTGVMDLAGVPDRQLLQGFVDGRPVMLAQLVRRYRQPLYGFLYRLTGDRGRSADLFQDTFLRVLKYAGSFDGRSRVRTWIFAIAINLCRSQWRRKTLPQVSLAAARQLGEAPDMHRDMDRVILNHRIDAALAELPPQQREVVVLTLYEEMSYPEISRLVGRPLGTVKSQMRLALAKLRPALKDLAESENIA